MNLMMKYAFPQFLCVAGLKLASYSNFPSCVKTYLLALGYKLAAKHVELCLEKT